MRAALLSLLFVITLVGCEANYRYPCQDPANWNNEECKKPACVATGECSENLVGQQAWDAAHSGNTPAAEEAAPAAVEPCPAPATPTSEGVE